MKTKTGRPNRGGAHDCHSVPLKRKKIPALGKQRQEDHEFQDNLGYTVRPCVEEKVIQGKCMFIVSNN
jgi:hypothetical protein